MSDETPTQRLPETPANPEPPAEGAAPAGETPAAGELAAERKKSRALLYTLIGVAAALLLAIIVLLVLFLTRDGVPVADPTPTDTPTASDSPTPTPTASETPTPTPSADDPAPPPPPPPVSTIVSYSVSTTDAGCADDTDSREITFNWNTTGTSVAFGIGTEFAESQPYESGLPPVGGITVNYQCSEDGPDQIYSIAAIGPNGDVIGRETITVQD